MGKVIAGFVVLALLAGAGFGLMRMGLPPFGKRAKRAAAPAAAAPAAAAAPGEAPAPQLDPGPPPLQGPTPEQLEERARSAERGMARLASVFEGMPAEDASRIVARLPDTLVEGLLRRIDERQAGRLLAAMPLERAARLTRCLAR